MKNNVTLKGTFAFFEANPTGDISPIDNIVYIGRRATGNISPVGDIYPYPVAPRLTARAGVRPVPHKFKEHEMTQNEYIEKNYPLPWHVDFIEMPPTRKCHHKTRTWIAVAANGRRVWWTQEVVGMICETINAAMSAK